MKRKPLDRIGFKLGDVLWQLVEPEVKAVRRIWGEAE